MKHPVAWLLLCSAPAFLASDEPAFARQWKVHSSISGHESDLACTFERKDQELTGTCVASTGALAITGKVDGKNVTWRFNTEYNGDKLTLVYHGKIESPEKIAGTVDVEPIGVTGEFTATASK